ncbi:phosphotransferase (plasmid) [Mycolicibacterium psychrotolerans]|uniref:phosphotransferase n=1 Tax=Mycolicibacterium psychrotolerans TaxID=216929 RepID=UPI003D66D6C7
MPQQPISAAFSSSYGIDVEDCRPLGGELNQTYAITANTGDRYVVKLFDVDTVTEHLRWQHRLLDAFVDHPDVRAPRVIRDTRHLDMVPVLCAGERSTMTAYEWLPGKILADLDEHTDDLLDEWGRLAGHIVVTLADAPLGVGVRTTHDWDLMNAPALLRAVLPSVADAEQIRLVQTALDWFESIVDPRRSELPTSVVHQDLNDYNVLAEVDSAGRQHICGVIDFADALHSARVTEIAIAAGYATLRKSDPLRALTTVVRGFHAVMPLADDELAVLYPLAVARLALNAATWASRIGGPADSYGRARSQHTWATLAALSGIPPETAGAEIRSALAETSKTTQREQG